MAAKPSKQYFSLLSSAGLLFPALFLTSLGAYTLTLNPALFRNDSPETITACFTLGVSHPPGYPLYTLLGRLFALISLGNPAMTINFFSSFWGALGVCFFAANLYSFLTSLVSPKNQSPNRFVITFVCVIGSLCFALSKSYWSLSLAAKGGIYTFQVVLELVLLLYFQNLVRNENRQKAQNKSIYFLVFIFALGLANHWPSLILIIPAIALSALVYPEFPKTLLHFEWKKRLICLTIAVITLSVYLYLPLRSNLHPELNFGSPSSFKSLYTSLFRIGYFKRETLVSFMPTALSTIQDKSVYISNRFGNEFNPVFSLLAFFGVFLLWRSGRKKELLFLLLLLLTTVMANILYLQVSPIEYWHLDDHLITVNWIIAFLSSFGGYFLFARVRSHNTLKYVLPILLLVLPILTFQKNLLSDDQTKEFLYWGYGMEALKSMDQNSRYFAESDYDFFSILYLKDVEHKRPDVTLKISTFLTKDDWDNLVREVSSESSPAGHPIYCAFPNGDFINGYLHYAKTSAFKPTGTVVEFMPPKKALQKSPDLGPLEDLWERHLAPERRSGNPIDGLLMELCAYPYLNMANYLKFFHNMKYWNSYYSRALSLIQNPRWHYETEFRMLAKDEKYNSIIRMTPSFNGCRNTTKTQTIHQ